MTVICQLVLIRFYTSYENPFEACFRIYSGLLLKMAPGGDQLPPGSCGLGKSIVGRNLTETKLQQLPTALPSWSSRVVSHFDNPKLESVRC